MSTNSIISSANAPDNGVWCHWDGYPTWVGKCICDLMVRDGAEETIRVLVEDSYGWSHLEPEQTTEMDTNYYDPARFYPIPGYGVAYTEQQGGDTHPLRDGDWGYLLHDDGDVHIYYDGSHIGTVNAFSQSYETELNEIENKIYNY